MQIHHDGVTLHVAEDGNPAAPPILLLHGITSFGGTWEWLVPELAERFRVLLLDADRPFDPPTLIVTADPAKPDAVADPGVARHFASISPATEVVTIAGAGHLIHDEVASRPAFRVAVMDFLARFVP